MAKRTETVKCNCPACGVGLRIDLDDLSVIADGDTAKKPNKPAGSKVDSPEAVASDNESGSKTDSPASVKPGSGETATDQATDSAKADADNSSGKQAESEDEGLGGW